MRKLLIKYCAIYIITPSYGQKQYRSTEQINKKRYLQKFKKKKQQIIEYIKRSLIDKIKTVYYIKCL